MRTLLALFLLFDLTTAIQAAEPLRCSSFLHGADGSWRSVSESNVFGPNGAVHVRLGEILRPTAKGEKGDLARALNGLCEGS